MTSDQHHSSRPSHPLPGHKRGFFRPALPGLPGLPSWVASPISMPVPVRDPRKLDITYPSVIVLARSAFLGMDLRIKVEGESNVPRKGGAVMAINHTSYVDFTFAGLAARESNRLVRFMAKESTFRHPVSGLAMRSFHHIPVDREAGAASYKKALDALRAGEIIGLYPEATISLAWEIKSIKTGAVRMAQEAGVPLLPTIVWGAHRIWTKRHPRNLGRSGFAVLIEVGEPIHVTPDDDVTEATELLRARMSEILHRLQDDYPDRPAPGEDSWWIPRRLGGSAPTLQEAEAAADEARAKRRAKREAALGRAS